MISITNLVKKYKSFELSIDNLNIQKSKIYGLIGMNGSGKTTLMKLIFNLTRPNQGTITLNDENLFVNKNLAKIAFFPDQSTIPLEMSVHDYWKYIASLAGIEKEKYQEKEKELLNICDLEKQYKQSLKTLSSGQKKKAILGGVLLTQPEIIFLDEPTANLDIKAKTELLDIIKYLAQIGVGIFITSHNAEEMQDLVDHVFLIKEGKILYDQSFDKKKDKIVEIYTKFYIDEAKFSKTSVDKLYNAD